MYKFLTFPLGSEVFVNWFSREVRPKKGKFNILFSMHIWHSGLLICSAFYKMSTMTNDREEIARHYLCSIYVLPVGKDFSFHTSFTTSYSNFTQFISSIQGIAIIYTFICMQAYWIWKSCSPKKSSKVHTLQPIKVGKASKFFSSKTFLF